MATSVRTKPAAKMSSEDRRAAIVKAVRRVFAEKGFDGTTTRELAEAALVSEALLFKHFPNKEALYSAMLKSCCNEQDHGMFERLMALEPSASTLVLMVHFLFSRILGDSASANNERVLTNRLMIRSLAEDGEFARVLLRGLEECWIPKIEDSIEAAIAAGDAVGGRKHPKLLGWFSHHLAAMIGFNLRPKTPVVAYGVAHEKLVEQAVWFALRGMGLTDQAIRRHYNPKGLALFTN